MFFDEEEVFGVEGEVVWAREAAGADAFGLWGVGVGVADQRGWAGEGFLLGHESGGVEVGTGRGWSEGCVYWWGDCETVLGEEGGAVEEGEWGCTGCLEGGADGLTGKGWWC